jgi:ABC-type Na+ transport system ATPase subunit NatA
MCEGCKGDILFYYPCAFPSFRLNKEYEMLEVRYLTKKYHRIPVVNDVHFMVQRGEILGYLGSNGAGKSTTVKILAGLVEPSSGVIYFDGKQVSQVSDAYNFKHSRVYMWGRNIFYATLLRHPSERAVYGFFLKQLTRSRDQKIKLALIFEDEPDPLMLNFQLSYE